MRLSPSDGDRGSRTRRLFIAGVAVLVLPVLGLAAKRLYEQSFPSRMQDRFAKLDLDSLPSLPKLPEPAPQAPETPPRPQAPVAAVLPAEPAPAAPTLKKEIKEEPAAPKPAPQAAKTFKKPKLRRLIGLSEMNLGSRRDFGTTMLKPPAPTPIGPGAPPAPTTPAPQAPPAPAPQQAKTAAPAPPPQPRVVYSAPPVAPAQLRPPPPAPTSEEVVAQPVKSASLQPVDPGPAVLLGAPDTPPPPNPERPMTRGGPCPTPGWWKNTYSDMCYSTIESCRGSSNGNGDCVQGGAAPVGPCSNPARCQPK